MSKIITINLTDTQIILLEKIKKKFSFSRSETIRQIINIYIHDLIKANKIINSKDFELKLTRIHGKLVRCNKNI